MWILTSKKSRQKSLKRLFSDLLIFKVFSSLYNKSSLDYSDLTKIFELLKVEEGIFMAIEDKSKRLSQKALYLEDSYEKLHVTYSFQEYLDKVKMQAHLARNSFQRMYDMINQYGKKAYEDAKKEVISYHFFQDPFKKGKDAVFGLDVPLMKLVHILKAAALGYGPVKRVILLHGPVGSAKSTICRLLKKGLEVYSRQEQGAIYTFDWIDEKGEFEDIFGKEVRYFKNPMNENPLLLLPLEKREEFLSSIKNKTQWPLEVQGELCPPSQHIFKSLMVHYKGEIHKVFEHVKMRRFLLSEKDRIGIGTFQPKDEKNQDSTELTGDINFRKIVQYGSDSDPRAFNFDGEFNIANRGMIEFVEMLKLDVAFLYDLLTASQEHMIKPKKFAQTYIDEVIIGHTNEPEYQKFIDNEFMEALRDRTVKVDIPYITKLDDEVKIYERDFSQKKLNHHSTTLYLAPHCLEMVAMWSVLTRLETPKKSNLDLLKKLKLYNGELLNQFTPDNVKELRKSAEKEGLHGISPRYIQDKISKTLVLSQELGHQCITPPMLLKELESGLRHHSLISSEEVKDEYIKLIKQVEKEYNSIIEREVRESFCFDDHAVDHLFQRYKEEVLQYCTGKSCDEKFMRSIENKIDINEVQKNDFRQEVSNYVKSNEEEGNGKGPFKIDGKLREALEAKDYEDKKERLKQYLLKSDPQDFELKEKVELAKKKLIKEFHYDEISAPLILERVSNIISKQQYNRSNNISS